MFKLWTKFFSHITQFSSNSRSGICLFPLDIYANSFTGTCFQFSQPWILSRLCCLSSCISFHKLSPISETFLTPASTKWYLSSEPRKSVRSSTKRQISCSIHFITSKIITEVLAWFASLPVCTSKSTQVIKTIRVVVFHKCAYTWGCVWVTRGFILFCLSFEVRSCYVASIVWNLLPFCFCLTGTGIIGVCHHFQLWRLF